MTDEQRAHIERALSTLVNLQPIIANGLLDRRQLAFIDPHHEIAMEALEAVLIAEPAEPVQEPVAWIQPDHLQKARVAPFLCRVEPTKRCADFVPFWTDPPQRKPLTDEEILEAVGWERAEMYMKLTPNFPVEEARKETLKNARAVERAHGIKERP